MTVTSEHSREGHHPFNQPDAHNDIARLRNLGALSSLRDERLRRWHEPPFVAEERRKMLLDAYASLRKELGPDPLVEELGRAPLPTYFGHWTYVVFGDRTTGSHASALVYGDMANRPEYTESEVPVRVHSSNSPSELFLARECGDCDKIESWMKTIHKANGPGVIVFLEHDGRGNGMTSVVKDLEKRFYWEERVIRVKSVGEADSLHQNDDRRDFGVARRILNFLNIRHPKILTSNAEKLKQLGGEYNNEQGLSLRGGLNHTPANGDATYNAAMARLLLRELDLEWKRLWESIELNKALLQSHDSPIAERLGQAPLSTRYGDWTIIPYGDYTSGEVHLALVYGEFRDALDGKVVYPARIHSSCQTNERFHAVNCECRRELHVTMENIQREGKGVIVYLQQEGRGTGVYGKLHQLGAMFEFIDGKIVQKTLDGEPITTVKGYQMHNFPGEIRDFTVAEQMLLDLGVRQIAHYGNNPRKTEGLTGIVVAEHRRLVFPDMIEDNPVLKHDLEAKRKELGHVGLDGYFNDSSSAQSG